MYFSYDALVIGSKLSVARPVMHKARSRCLNKHNSVTFRSSLLAFDLRETGLFERVCLAQIHFLLFLRDTSPAYEIPHNWSNLLGENLSKYKYGT